MGALQELPRSKVISMPKLSKKGQVTIPKKIRDILGLKRGDTVEFILQDGNCILRKKKVVSLDKWIGALGEGKTDEIIKEMRGR